eukprot:TRINITY_DN3007_c0_g1_i12.p5 TRINITY_DN3007_c0_g1~~TRINITY_DN3007_c0_g1_i12.p5  ORF type:complete len:135 (+),score=30.62 TRINITY_DN3007_c0_g1_i12:1908-2312(+)
MRGSEWSTDMWTGAWQPGRGGELDEARSGVAPSYNLAQHEMAPQLSFAAAGRVYDVTNQDVFLRAYGDYAGRDASICLARLSLQQQDIGRTDWDALTAKDVEVLEDWIKYFDERYVCIGHLKEWNDWQARNGKK